MVFRTAGSQLIDLYKQDCSEWDWSRVLSCIMCCVEPSMESKPRWGCSSVASEKRQFRDQNTLFEKARKNCPPSQEASNTFVNYFISPNTEALLISPWSSRQWLQRVSSGASFRNEMDVLTLLTLPMFAGWMFCIRQICCLLNNHICAPSRATHSLPHHRNKTQGAQLRRFSIKVLTLSVSLGYYSWIFMSFLFPDFNPFLRRNEHYQAEVQKLSQCYYLF